MSESVRRRRLLPLLWLLMVALLGVHQWQFWQASRLDTNILALLPADEHQPAVHEAIQRIAGSSGNQILLLVGARDWSAAQQAAGQVRQLLAKRLPDLKEARADTRQADALLAFYQPWRQGLLTAEQRAWLSKASPGQLGATALMALYQPGSSTRLTSWQDDPLGLWSGWWSARASDMKVSPRDNELALSADGREWVMLRYVQPGSPFAVTGDSRLLDTLAVARTQLAARNPDSQLLSAGIPLHAEAAATQASHEISTIGLGSLLAILLLVWLTFRSLQPIALVALSLVIGTAAAISVTGMLFGQVHLLTLIFGASLVGVAEDYGFHYFAARQGQPVTDRHHVLRRLLPGLTLALLTSALAYLALGLAPFPGLRQIAVFSVIGLTAAFLTVVCWFPWLDRSPLPDTRFARRVGDSLSRWPVWQADRRGLLMAAALTVLIAGGLVRLGSSDDLRQLQNTPAELMAEQLAVSRLLGVPSPAQFYLVEAADADTVLMREEQLKTRLDTLIASNRLTGYRAVSDWLPSAQRQREDALLVQDAEATALASVADATGETLSRPAVTTTPMTWQDWQSGPAAAVVPGQWLGRIADRHYSVVLLHGVTPALTPTLADTANGLTGVRWIDSTRDYSNLLGRYRISMTWLLLAAYVAVLGALCLRFGRSAWRAWLPTLLGSLLTVALLGWLGMPLQLFHVLALVLLLGMGIDYGIFLLEHPDDRSAWLAVALAGISTMLAFGLLALSSTPALSAFGITMLLGELLIWFLTPCFRYSRTSSSC